MRSIDCSESPHREELLHGCKQIAAFLNLTPRQVFYRTATGELPHFRIGQTICARPDTLRAWIAEREASTVRGVNHG